MSCIIYKPSANPREIETVHLDGRKVGAIKKIRDGFAYYPYGGGHGDVFPTINEVKKSLEDEQ